MKHIFAILPHQASSRSFRRYFKFACQAEFHAYSPLIPETEIIPDEWVSQTFADISDWLNDEMSHSDLKEAIGIIEIYDERLLDLSSLNPVHIRQFWAAVAAMLILAFPEIHWIFITPYALKKEPGHSEENERFDKVHRLRVSDKKLNLREILKIYDGNYSPLFDPLGFRYSIRESIVQTDSEKNEFDYLPRRKEVVVAIDEEEDYIHFVSYIAYRFGYCVAQVNSYFILKMLGELSPGNFDVFFEDVFLNFPDRPLEIETLSQLKKRHEDFPILQINGKKRVLVTSDHQPPKAKAAENKTNEEPATFSKTAEEIEAESEANYVNIDLKPQKVRKPFSGIFKFWAEAGMNGFAPEYGKTSEKMKKPGNPNESVRGHSAPGRLLIIANCLIKRATHWANTADTVKKATLGATLALEALDYLGNRTPTVSLQALSLKHKSEVIAESMFYGVGYSISQEARFSEIKEKIKSIGEWFAAESDAVLNAEIKIINDMALIFQQQGLFDEESECMEKIRSLYLKLFKSRNQKKRTEPEKIISINTLLNRIKSEIGFYIDTLLNRIEYGIRFYIDTLLKSIWNFLFAVSLWVWSFAIIFTVVNVFMAKEKPASLFDCLAHGLYDACIAFFSMQPAHDMAEVESEEIILVVSIFCIVISYIHLGIFISYIYSLIIRKQ